MPVSLPDHATPRATGRAIVGLALLLALPWLPLQAADAESLAFLTWADYLDPGLEAEFERETGIDLQMSYYESDDHRDEWIAASDGRGLDLVIVSGGMLPTYAERGWLAPIDRDAVPTAGRVDQRWQQAFPGSERYGVAYFWGTLGIGYRSDLVPAGFTRWSEFFRPADELRGRLSVLKSVRDVVGMALKSMGESANSTDRDAIRRAGELLLAQKPYVRTYEYMALNERSELVSGEVWAAMMYSGDALMLQEYDDRIVYVVPQEGSNLWVDYLAVLQASPRKDLAWKFIEFLNRPAVAARNAQYLHYATPNLDAEPLLPREHLADPLIYPGADVLDRSEIYRDLPPRVQKTFNQVFANVLQ